MNNLSVKSLPQSRGRGPTRGGGGGRPPRPRPRHRWTPRTSPRRRSPGTCPPPAACGLETWTGTQSRPRTWNIWSQLIVRVRERIKGVSGILRTSIPKWTDQTPICNIFL